MNTATEASVPASAPEATDAKAIAFRIASLGPDMGIEAPKSAPASVNTGKVSTESQQPDAKGQVQEQPKTAEETAKPDGEKAPEVVDGKTVQPTEAKPEAANPDTAKTEAAAAEAEQQLLRQRIGLKTPEPETIESLRKARAESSKEAHRLVEEAKLRDKLLSEINLKVVKKADGSYGIKADDAKIAENLKTIAPTIMSSLTEEEKALVHSDVANKIIQQTLEAVAVKSPRSTVTESDTVLPDSEIQMQLNSLAAERLPDKSQVFHGLEDNSFVGLMQEVFSSPELDAFRVVANRSPENMKQFLKLVHGMVYRGYAPVLAKKADSEAQKKAKLDEQKREPSPSPSGKSPVDTKGSRGVNPSDIALRIAKSV